MINSINLDSRSVYSSLPNLIIGFHGCDKSVFEKILYSHEPFKASVNNYDWLGNGMYFWENNLERAWEWAKSGLTSPKFQIKEPAVIGAIIDLGYCLNLLDSSSIQILKNQYEIFKSKMTIADKPIPENKNIQGNHSLILRYLDCAVIQDLHQERKKNQLPQFDSVRGVFFEGNEIYPTSGFREQSHIQICVRNPNCIKGFFAPKDIDTSWEMV